jgi:hypothetical protein
MGSAMIFSFRKSYGQFITSGAQLILLHIGLTVGSRTGGIVCLILTAIISLFAWMSTLRRRRAITNTPTSRIASAAQGYVELIGTGRPLDGLPLLSHLTQRPCLWCRWKMEEKYGNKWRTVDRGESEFSFLIDDGSGHCIVDVEGAEILTRHKEIWCDGSYRCTEWNLLINDRIYAIGEFRTLDGGSVELDARLDLKELLAEWKKDRATLLKRFDLDGNGEIDEKEWELARQTARREVSRIHQEVRNAPDVHMMTSPGNGRHYLLSNIGPDQLTNRYLFWAIFHMTVFLGTLGGIPWVLRHYA